MPEFSYQLAIPVLLIVAGGILWFFLRKKKPAEVNSGPLNIMPSLDDFVAAWNKAVIKYDLPFLEQSLLTITPRKAEDGTIQKYEVSTSLEPGIYFFGQLNANQSIRCALISIAPEKKYQSDLRERYYFTLADTLGNDWMDTPYRDAITNLNIRSEERYKNIVTQGSLLFRIVKEDDQRLWESLVVFDAQEFSEKE
jgi:hypothetical protein